MKKTMYIKRLFAVFVSAAMLTSTIPEVLAESFSASESTASESAEDIAAWNTASTGESDASDDGTGFLDGESTGTEEEESPARQTEEAIPEESTGTEVVDSFSEGDFISSEEGTMETVAPDDADSEEFIPEDTTEMLTEDLVGEESEIELCLNLLTGGETSSTSPSPSLSLERAKKMKIAGNESSDVLSQSGNTLIVAGAAGLVLLSNILPQEYKNLDIALKTTNAGWNVTGQQEYIYKETTEEGAETTNTITCSFLGLANAENPYAGTMTIVEGSTGYSIMADRALFNVISTDATLPGNINFMMAGNNSRQIILADQVDKGSGASKTTLECEITLTTSTGADAATSDTIGGVIGTLGEYANASVTLTNNLGTSEKPGTLTVFGSDNCGLFCNTMESGSSLTASLTNSGNATITVTATSGDAGGYVGKMSGNNTLSISGKAVNTVNSNSGNAGGLVGSATDATIIVTNGETTPFALSDVTITAANKKSAGGLVGDYTNTNTIGVTLDLAQFNLDTTLFSGSESNVGGVFGTLTNSGSYTISGGSVTSKLTVGTNYGGLIGKYEAQTNGDTSARDAMLNVSNDTQIISTGGNNATTYGGVIGRVSGSSYVAMDNVSVSTAQMSSEKEDLSTSFGGLVGEMEDGLLNVGNVTLNSNNNDIAADKVKGRGGLVGAITKGVLRLHGTTDLTAQKITDGYHHTGQIVGNNVNGLVYAIGDGSGNYNGAASADAWTLKRYKPDSDSSRGGSDIGNWGEVVRLNGITLKEMTVTDENALFIFDQINHTVTVQGASVDRTTDPSKNTVTLITSRDFASYALAFNLNSSTEYTGNSGTLIFNNVVNPSLTQDVTLSADVELTGTGILGIGKDDDKRYCNIFTGTFDGGNHTITLDIGSTYGNGISAESGNGSGQIYMRRSDGREGHTSLALFPYTNGAIIKNLTVFGNVNCLIAQKGKNSEEKWPVFAAGVVGSAEGYTTFEHVTVNGVISIANENNSGESQSLYVMQGGILGQYAGDNTLCFTGCSWESTSSLNNTRTTPNNRIGGFAGRVLGSSTVEVSNCGLSGTITSNTTGNAAVGGLFAESLDRKLDDRNNFNYTNDNSTISISNLMVSDVNISATAANGSCGGLLGYSWNKTDVTFGGTTTNSEGTTITTTGVEISNSTLDAGSKATFGGLVYQATGYWNATAVGSIKFTKTADNKVNNFLCKSILESPSGLLVGTGLIKSNNNNALYLEVGTWGSDDAAYYIEPNSVTLTLGGSTATSNSYFDELVGVTINSEGNLGGNAGHDNAVVSLATPDHALIDYTACNTYTSQLGKGTNFKNGKTRYYYNLDSYRSKGEDGKSTLSVDSLNFPGQVLSWSASQYAASNIRDYFCSNPTGGAIISGSIDLTGYSYYPVSSLATVEVKDSTLTFAYEEMNSEEDSNKPLSDSDHQHDLMHHGLLYNTGSNVTVTDTIFNGTVGKNSDGSGALIFGSVNGDPTKNPVEVTLENVTLADLRVAGVVKGTTTYAPLLINKITQAVKLNVTGLSTGMGYVDESKNTAYAATSLIGNVGDVNATKLTLTFSDIALDGRLAADAGKSTSVYNNGTVEVTYNTTHTIFTNATLLESFAYKSEGSGTYNFNSTDGKVTYGVELSNSGESGRNPDKQYQYYDAVVYVTDEHNKTGADGGYVNGRYTDKNFIRYVHVQQNVSKRKYELDINQKATGLTAGCGTYGDPYIITDSNQLISLAYYFAGDEKSKGFEAVFNSKVLSEKKQTTTSYHVKDKATTLDTGTDTVYTWDGTNWEDAKGTTADSTTAMSYLLNAYYKIEGGIKLSAEKFAGLGTLANPFSGVIVGENNNTVSIGGTNDNKTGFGGLIAFSRGSVVKDLTVDYTVAKITMDNADVPGKGGKNPFFGGVVGYCMGGDTIIDNVSVRYVKDSVTLSGDKARLIAAGGYVGLVGGAKETGETYKDYEKNGGGVVFRNMDSHINNFADCQTNAKEDSSYFYCNPYVGRVLDGYACYDTQTTGTFSTPMLNNTDKNYTIPDLVTEEKKGLSVEGDDTKKVYNVTVTSAQGLWLLSAIVNSGAGAMDSDYSYNEMNNSDVDAYNLGKPRSALYDKIGTGDGASDLADEAYWGGISTTDKSRVSYLVKKYTEQKKEFYYAAQITGGSSSRNSVSLIFNTDLIDMSSYQNGFRGIGSSFGSGQNTWDKTGNLRGHFLYVKGITGDENTTKICLEIDRHDYWDNYDQNGWFVRGTGLFTGFSYQTNCEIKNLTLTGNIKLTIYDVANGTQKDGIEKNRKRESFGDITVGGFAGHTVNANGAFSFDGFRLEGLEVYGGHHAAGAIGLLEQAGGSKDVTFTNWSIGKDSNDIGVSVSKKTYDDGSSGGLLGWCRNGSVTITGYGKESTNWNVDGLTVKAESQSRNTAAAGGLVGATDGTAVTITDVRAQDLIVNGIKAKDVGGLVAGNKENNGKVTIKECYFKNLTISGEGSLYIGGVLGHIEKDNEINDVTITGINSICGSSGYVGGIIGYANTAFLLSNCRIIGDSVKPVKISSGTDGNYVGGLIGYNSSTTTIKDCTEEYVKIYSANNNAGGLTGQLNNTTYVSNVAFSNVFVVTKKNDKYVGLLVGNTNTKTFNGYNILADSCTVGYNISATIDNFATIDEWNSENNKVGLWFGNSSGTSKLVAIAAKGKNQPHKDVGSGTASITYADYPVAQDYNPDGTTSTPKSALPWLDVNPKSTLSVKESESATAKIITGNGVGYTMTEETETKETETKETETKEDVSTDKKNVQKSCGEVILTEAKSEKDSKRKYWNVKDESNVEQTFSKFLKGNNDVYLTTYQTEERGTGTIRTTTVPSITDFPILVVSGLADADTEIWNYIAALTNVKDGGTAKEQAESATAATYKWTKNAGATEAPDGTFAGSFVRVNVNTIKDSLTVNKDNNTISITKNAYDNQQSQFTLLTVKYKNPTVTTSNEDDYFYLYVPVLVKKVLYASFSAKFLAGTNYRKQAYTDSTATYATAGFDEPVTAYIEYNYNRSKSDWEKMLENGDNLLWNYDKVLDLAKDNKDAIPLPNGTRLTLVDKQTGQCYIHTFSSTTDHVDKFDLSTMTLDGTTSTKAFEPVPICDLLELTIDKELDAGKTQYVSLGGLTETGNVPYGATVKINNIYYRKATDEDTDNRCTISVGNVFNSIDNPSYLKQGEGYYLTIQVPSDSGVSVVNNSLSVNSTTMTKEGAPLASIRNLILIYSNYDIYDGVQQSDLVITTSRIRNGEQQSDTIMEDGDSIQVTLTTTLKLSDDQKVRDIFKTYPPNELDHQFNINMKKYNEDGVASAVLIGATRSGYTYTITKSGETTPWKTISNTESGSEAMDVLKIDYGSDIAKAIVDYLKENTNGTLTIQAVITLPYPTLGTYFPGRSGTDTTSGISVSADSRVATADTQLPITTHKNTAEDTINRFYTEDPSNAKLTYNTYDGDATGDSTRKLGINPSDTINDLDGLIYTNGVYDYSGVETDILSQATQIKYTLELFQKGEDGSYAGSPLGRIDEYLPSITVTGNDRFGVGSEKNAETLTKPFTKDSTSLDTINIKIKPLTGAEFEANNFTYANYKVRLTAVLLKSDGTELPDTKASDYIIYTNARICQQMIQQAE